MAGHGTFFWNELNTHNVESAQAFYEKTLGWSFSEMPMPQGSYWTILMNGQPVGGIFAMVGPDFAGMPDHWFTYIEVDDVDRRIASVTENGGMVLRPAWDIPEIGRIAVVKDSTGAVSGWITPLPRQG